MDFELKTLALAKAPGQRCDLLVLLVEESFAPAAVALRHGDFKARAGSLLQCYAPPTIAARSVLLLGAGDGSPVAVRKAVLALAGLLKAGVSRHVVFAFGSAPGPDAVGVLVRCVAEASYVYTTTKSKAEPRTLARVTVGVPDVARVRVAFDTAVAVVAGVEFAREWANRPANHATPTMLGEAARSLARHAGISCKLHGPAQVARLGMSAFMAVAQGSSEPLRFIELHYQGGLKTQAPVVLVGKGITFDAGGISLKPAAGMDEMKFDMGGAASVLGTFRALAELRPRINVVGLIPSCENLPDGKAVKPGDVVTSMSGQTIEILNTDAEGRLALCDALTYAARFKPKAVVDMATLTGACVVALGAVRSGLFASDDALAEQLLAAGEAALDPCWRMPLDDEYADGLKSAFADVANVAGRPAGAVTAAKFLQRFVGAWPWAHLDIAGTAWKSGSAKGATGRPVGLLVHYLLAAADAAPVRRRGK
jgi:leucyl aminopeptidase